MKIELDSDIEAMGDLSEILRLKFKVKFHYCPIKSCLK